MKSASWVQVLDMDGDSDLDLVTASFRGVHWWQFDGNAFTKNLIGSFKGAWAVHADDVDADGDIDVIGASSGVDEFRYWERKGGTNFSKISLGASLGPESVHAGDLDGDGDLDIVGAAWSDDQILWWRNDGKGRFIRKVLDPDMRNAHSVYTGDLDNDGQVDVLAAGVAGTRWYRSDGTGRFQKNEISNKGGWSVFIEDIDKDGDQDFLRPQRDTGDVVLFWNDGSGSFEEEIVESSFGDCWAIVARDVDGDGSIDIAGAGFAANQLKVWLNDGGNQFLQSVVVDSVDKPRGVFVADLDYDGDGDIVAAIRGDRDLAWYEVVGTPKSIVVQTPGDGQELFGGSDVLISWDFTGLVSIVDIELSTDGGRTWTTTVVDSLTNDGAFVWSVPEVTSDSCRIRVSDSEDLRFFGVSDGFFTITPSRLFIETPNGGETWSVVEDRLITWTTVGKIDSVDLEYTPDGGRRWAVMKQRTPNDGHFLWTLPEITSDSCSVRIRDSADGHPVDQSDAFFSIRGSHVVLHSPNGSERWFQGTTQVVEWESEGRIDSVALEFSLDGGTSWFTIVASTENTGRYEWQLPYAESDSVLVRVVSLDGRFSDVSDEVFSIESLSLTLHTPNGGESWFGGTLQSVTWESVGPIDSVKLQYSLNAGSSWIKIADSLENSGRFEWLVPGVRSQECLLRVSVAEMPSISDVSDSLFSILGSTLTVTSPNGGEELAAGATHQITWNTVGPIDSVTLDYSLDDGRSWATIVERVSNAGQLTWQLPNVASDSCRVRVSDADDGTPMALSSNVFSIGIVVSVEPRLRIPESYNLRQNYPNPFNLSTRIPYDIPETAEVSITIYDVLGRRVRSLRKTTQNPGAYSETWNGLNDHGGVVSSGIYFIVLQANEFTASLRVLLLK